MTDLAKQQKLRILKFESKTCAACISMNKKGVLATLQQEYPGIDLITLVIANEHGESPPGSTFEEAYELSDVVNVTQLPTYIIQDAEGFEFGRIEGTETLTTFRKTIEQVIKRIEEVEAEETASLHAYERVEAFRMRLANKPA